MLKLDSRDLLWDGHVWRTSCVDMAAGDCAKSSTMLYVWATLVEASLRHNGPLGIFGMTSALG